MFHKVIYVKWYILVFSVCIVSVFLSSRPGYEQSHMVCLQMIVFFCANIVIYVSRTRSRFSSLKEARKWDVLYLFFKLSNKVTGIQLTFYHYLPVVIFYGIVQLLSLKVTVLSNYDFYASKNCQCVHFETLERKKYVCSKKNNHAFVPSVQKVT